MEPRLLERRYGEFVYVTEVEAVEPLERRYGDLVVLTRRGRLRALWWGCALIPSGSAACFIGNAIDHHVAYIGDVVGYTGVFALILGICSLFNAAVGRYYDDGDL
jgi:hypothetical protein